MKLEKSCGVIVFHMQNETPYFLIVRHNTDHGGHWDFAKGHVEKDETEEQTALREVFEETAVEPELIIGFRESFTFSPARNVKKQVIYFLGRVESTQVTLAPDELQDFSWLSFADAHKKITYAEPKKILQKAHDFLNEVNHD